MEKWLPTQPSRTKQLEGKWKCCCVFVCVVCMHLCEHVLMGVALCVYTNTERRDIVIGCLLVHSLPYILRQGLSVAPTTHQFVTLSQGSSVSASHILELQAATLLPNFYMGSGSELWSSWSHIKRSMNQAVSPAPKAASFRLLLQAWSSCTVWTSVPTPLLLTSDQIYSKWYLEGSAAPADEKEELQCSFISHPLIDHLLEIC